MTNYYTWEQIMIDLCDSNKFYIFPISDLHYGSDFFNEELWKTWKREFESVYENKAIYLLGDILEFPTTRIDAYNSKIPTEDAINQVIDMLEPYKEYIRVAVSGNHELRAKKDFNLDVTKTFSKIFSCAYSKNDFFDTLSINGENLVVYGKHGTSTSKYPDLAMKNFKIDMGNVDANIYLQGHNHYCDVSQKFQRTNRGGEMKTYVFTGHYLNYRNSYAHDRGMTVSPPSFIRLDVDKELNVGFKKIVRGTKV